MRRLLVLPILLLLSGAAAAPPARPQRIVSLNLCADQYLIALADPGQIAALTRFSRDPGMSAAAGQAARLPVTRGTNEEVLVLRPDLIIAETGRRQATMQALAGQASHRRRIATLDVNWANSYPEIVAQVRSVAAAIGHPARGEALVARMDRALAAIPAGAGRGATAAYYQRRGYLTGTGTLIDDMMRRLGLRNLAARLDRPALARIGLEELAQARPDWLIVERESEAVRDQGTEMLHHPLIAGIPRLRVPQAWTVCGGPAYVLAVASLARQLRAGR